MASRSAELRVQIVRFVMDHQPPIVACEFVDAGGYVVLITAMALLALLIAAASALRAQGQQQTLVGMPEYGVLLTGSPEVPVVVNHSGRTIIGYNIRINGMSGGVDNILLVYSRSAAIASGAQHQPPGATDKKDPLAVHIPDGAARPSSFRLMSRPVVRAVLDAVLFDDGEYVGPADDFFDDATWKMGVFREVGKQLTAVKYASDAEIAAVWSKFEEMIPWRHDLRQLPIMFRLDPVQANRNSAVQSLLQERDLQGARLAFDLAEYYSSLPVPWRKK